MSHTIKDTGERRQYSTGAQRDRGSLKPRPDLIHPYFLFRYGLHLAKGGIKYDEWNWYKGMPLSDWYASLKRHVEDVGMGLEDEDHLSAIVFNVMGYMITQKGIETGFYPKEFDNMPDHTAFQDIFLNLSINEEILDEEILDEETTIYLEDIVGFGLEWGEEDFQDIGEARIST